MAWIYFSAHRLGDLVRATFREPQAGDRKEIRFRKGGETEQEFIARGREIVRQTVDGLNQQQTLEQDVTNTFRPQQSGGQ